ncbi:hypothetical protein SLE2022_340500 [Rubroshorea leprosula]
MADDLILLNLWSSPFGMRVRITLAEKGLDYKLIEEDLSNKSPLLLKMNPVHNHKSPLFPSDPYARANARFWVDYVDKKIYAIGKLVWGATGEIQEAAKKELIECFKVLEGELGEKSYFGGESLGIVDVALIPFYSWFYVMETSGNFNIVAECPKLVSWASWASWAKRCMERESVSKTLPDQYKMFCCLLELKKKFQAQ